MSLSSRLQFPDSEVCLTDILHGVSDESLVRLVEEVTAEQLEEGVVEQQEEVVLTEEGAVEQVEASTAGPRVILTENHEIVAPEEGAVEQLQEVLERQDLVSVQLQEKSSAVEQQEVSVTGTEQEQEQTVPLTLTLRHPHEASGVDCDVARALTGLEGSVGGLSFSQASVSEFHSYAKRTGVLPDNSRNVSLSLLLTNFQEHPHYTNLARCCEERLF